MNKKKAISILSGGLDSTVATILASKNFKIEAAITFDYGQRAAKREIEASANLCKRLKIEQIVIDLPWLSKATNTALVNKNSILPSTTPESVDNLAKKNAKAVWVPNRNGVFVAISAAIAESRDIATIITGFNAEEAETFPDNSGEFIDKSNSALKLSTLNHVTMNAPMSKMAKAEIAKQFIGLKIDNLAFWCCYEGMDKMCGKCESCARTIRAFKKIDSFEHIKNRFVL